MSEYFDIPGYFGVYQITKSGVIRSVDRKLKCSNGCIKFKKGIVLKQYKTTSGYHQIDLRINKIKHKELVHLLVLKTFYGDRPNGKETRHIDGNKSNNSISNLAYGTKRENYEDKILHDTIPYGSRHTNAKLSESDIPEIRQLLLSDYTLSYVANKFNVSISLISLIKLNRRWVHV